MENRPNILLLMADQWNYSTIRALGHPTVKTPNLDNIVKGGTSFSNFYCNSPLCAPSRSVICTGKYVRNTHVYDNGAIFPSDLPTFMHHLRLGGYETILAGKIHFIGADQLHGLEKRLTTNIYPANLDWTPDWSKGTYGNYGTSIRRCKKTNPCEPWNMQMSYDEEVLFRTLEFIRERGSTENKQKQFFLWSSFSNPHEPYSISQKYWDLYNGVEIPLPAIHEDYEDLHLLNQWLQIHHELDQIQLDENDIRNFRRAYYGMVSYFDHNVGLIIQELENQDLLDSTIVLITSDHGDMLGEHGMWFKRTFYEDSIRVPFVAYWPGKVPADRSIDQVVSLVDLCPTLLDLSQVDTYEPWLKDIDGNSFVELLFYNTNDWKNEAMCEYYSEGVLNSYLTYIKGQYKYVYINKHDPLLFDLRNDPHELTNLAGKDELAEIETSMHDRVKNGINLDEIENTVALSQQRRLLIMRSMKKDSETFWDYHPHFDATEQYVRFKGQICEYHRGE